ncbi:MAG: alpha-L-fucosidase [Lentisphaeria bacterium]|nr:alpha-L-fucosidase [Lentisphaeria bacterium]
MSKIKWFTDSRFGMFIHWGIYAIPAIGEWAYAQKEWKENEYQGFAKVFDPQKFDPGRLAKLASAAGMKYVVFTTRHHDGFCMFDSHYTDYKVTNTPYGKDIVRMVVEAFRKEGLKIGFYHSLPDWTHPGYADPETPEYMQKKIVRTPTAQEYADFKELLFNHIEQLMTGYGKIDLLFCDYTSKYKDGIDYFDRERILEMVYRHQPDIIVNDRLAYFKDDVCDFDYYTPEICVMNAPPVVKGKEVVWESCTTMNDHWGYCAGDNNYKDAHSLISALMGCVSQSGNMLLNVGPDADGCIGMTAEERLREIGRWFDIHSDAVYGCSASKHKAPYGCCYTQNGNKLYCFLLITPVGDIILPELKGKIESIKLMRTQTEVKIIDFWGYELLKSDEERIRPAGAKAGDVLEITLREC